MDTTKVTILVVAGILFYLATAGDNIKVRLRSSAIVFSFYLVSIVIWPFLDAQIRATRIRESARLVNEAFAESDVNHNLSPGQSTVATQPSFTPSKSPTSQIEKSELPSPPKVPRARTLAEARAQKGLPRGVPIRFSHLTMDESFDVKGTPFGPYDAALIAAIQARWYDLMDEKHRVRDQNGKVVLKFRLNKDGSITEMKVDENQVSEDSANLCQNAVTNPAPYKPFPQDLQRMLQTDFRDLRFTFYFGQD